MVVVKERQHPYGLRRFVRQKCQPSLNYYPERRPSIIAFMLKILFKYRVENIVISDIKKTLCKIELQEKDRAFLRFLWKTNTEQFNINQ